MFEENLGNIVAAIGNAIIERRWCRGSLQSALLWIGGYHPVQGDRIGIARRTQVERRARSRERGDAERSVSRSSTPSRSKEIV